MKKIFFLWTCLMVALSSNAQTLYQEKDIHLDTVQNKTLDSSNQPINGIVKVFFENGKIQKEIPYENGLKNGVENWYWLNGNKRFMTHWKDGKYDGTLEEYRKDGTKRLSRTYSNGEKHGKKVLYHLNGKEKITFFYEHGKLVADGNNSGKEEPKEQKIYYDNGNPSCYLTYNEAEQTFVFTLFYRTGGKAMEISKKQEDTHGEKYSLDGKARNMTNDEVKVFEFMSGFSGLMSFCELGNDIIGDFMNEKY